MDAPAFVLTTSDRAFLRALRHFGGEPSPAFWAVLSPSWRIALQSAWDEHGRRADPTDAGRRLADDHRDEVHPNPRRIHPSWYVRALRDESPAVRLAVASHAGEPLGRLLRSGLNLDPLTPIDHPPHPEAIAWVLDFWTERLVGGPPPTDLDPVVIRSLTRLSRTDLLRLIIACGRVKLADSPVSCRREMVDLGRVTIGRLLTRAEPYRARWALQHLPYEMAKRLRAGIDTPVLDAQIEQEHGVLQTARERLRARGWHDAIGEDAS